MKLKTKSVEDLAITLYEAPFFLDTKDTYQWSLWKKLRRCNRIIRKLLVNDILNDEEISDIFIDFCVAYNMIDKMDFEVEIMIYFDNLLIYILDESVELEFYEASSNINRYQEHYYKKLVNDEN